MTWKRERREAFRLLRCASKQAYATWADAEAALEALLRDKPEDSGLLRLAYRCDYCGRWKLGHVSPKALGYTNGAWVGRITSKRDRPTFTRPAQ